MVSLRNCCSENKPSPSEPSIVYNVIEGNLHECFIFTTGGKFFKISKIFAFPENSLHYATFKTINTAEYVEVFSIK